MKDRNLINVLGSIPPDQILDLKKYVWAYAKEDTDPGKIFAYLIKNKKQLKDLPKTEEMVAMYFSHLSPKIFLNHLSLVLKYVQEWLILQEVKNDRYQYEILLQKIYNKNSLYNLSDYYMDRLLQKKGEESGLDLQDHSMQYLASFQAYYSNNPKAKKQGYSSLESVVQNFLETSAETAVLLKLELSNWGRIQKHDFVNEIAAMNELIALSPNNEIVNELAMLNRALVELDTTYFYTIIKNLKKGKYKKGGFLHTIVAEYATLIARRLHFMKKIDDRKVIFDLYDYCFMNKIYENNGNVTSITFLNIIHVVSSFLDQKRAILLTQKWIEKVQTKYREGTLALAHAHIYISFENYKELAKLTWRSDFETANQKGQAFAYNLITAFENRKKDIELFLLQYQRYNNYIKRLKPELSQDIYNSFFNLGLFIYELSLENKFKQIPYAPIMFRIWCEKKLTK